MKFLFEALSRYLSEDQATRVFDSLAWSFAQSRVYDPPCIFDAHLNIEIEYLLLMYPFNG